MTKHGATLTWAKTGCADFRQYELYRGTTQTVTPSATLVAAIANPGQTTFTDVTLARVNTEYFYKVFMRDTQGRYHHASSVVSVTTPDGAAEFALGSGDDGESGEKWGNDLPWTLIDDAGACHGGSRCWHDSLAGPYANDEDIGLRARLNLKGGSAPLFKFWHRYDLEVSNDLGLVEVSADRRSWAALLYVTGSSGGRWQEMAVDLTAYAGQTVWLRFRLMTNPTRVADGWWIDDMRLLNSEVASRRTGVIGVVSSMIFSGMSWSAQSFKPSRGESVSLRYALSAPAKVTVTVYDHDGLLVRQLVRDQARAAGEHVEEWDGKDLSGNIVPNAAYVATLAAIGPDGRTAVYDPALYSGVESGPATNIQLNRSAGTIGYSLPRAASISLRLGFQTGPMLKSLVSWEARRAGDATEQWDGKDEDGFYDLWDDPRLVPMVIYHALPEPHVFVEGSTSSSYVSYRSGPARDRPRKPPARDLLPAGDAGPTSPAALTRKFLSLHTVRASLRFPDFDRDGQIAPLPEFKANPLVKVDIESIDEPLLVGEEIEIAFYADNVFFAEQYHTFFTPQGYVSSVYPLELRKVSSGEHVLTVNIATFMGGFGVTSRRVKVSKGEAGR